MKNYPFLKTCQKCEKALSFTHCSFSVFKKLSLYNLLFSRVFRFEKWQPRTIPRSRPTASTSKRTSAAILGISKPLKKAKLYLDNFSSHLEKTMSEGKYHFFQKQCFLKSWNRLIFGSGCTFGKVIERKERKHFHFRNSLKSLQETFFGF